MTKSPVARLRTERRSHQRRVRRRHGRRLRLRHRADQAAHERLRPAAAEDPVPDPDEGRRALIVLDRDPRTAAGTRAVLRVPAAVRRHRPFGVPTPNNTAR